jgi:hypothetical protein
MSSIEGSVSLLHAALEAAAEQSQKQANLLQAAAVRIAQLEDELGELSVLLPGRPGRPLAKTPDSFRQEVLRLRAEHGWGRPRIAAAMRVPESRVRRVLKDAARGAGENPSARRGLPGSLRAPPTRGGDR